MNSIFSTIFSRISVRSFSDKAIPAEKLNELLVFANQLGKGPFGSSVRFALIDASAFDGKQLKTLGTYGMISGARYYLSGAVVPGPGVSEDFGWAMEAVILKATELGLGSCWLGGTLDRKSFGNHINLAENEVLPAATPLGIAPERPGTKQRIIRGLVGADKRKPFATLFFKGDQSTPLAETEAGPWLDCLMAVRQAPSASNKQPWRLVRSNDAHAWHFFMNEDPPYNRRFEPVLLQNMDLGIAMNHFQQVAHERGLQGGFKVLSPAPTAGSWTYISTWQT